MFWEVPRKYQFNKDLFVIMLKKKFGSFANRVLLVDCVGGICFCLFRVVVVLLLLLEVQGCVVVEKRNYV